MPQVIGPTTIAIPPAGFDIRGISLSDTFAAGNPGRMSLTVSVVNGLVSMDGCTPAQSITLTPTFTQANTALASLHYTGAGADTLMIDVWNQAGVQYGYTAAIGGVAPPVPVPLPVPPVGTQARRAREFGAAVALNTHIDFGTRNLTPQYADLAAVAKAVRYLWGGSGVSPLLRDSPGDLSIVQTWPHLAALCGARFVAYIGECPPADYQGYVDRALQLPAGLVAYLEGPNEEDSATVNNLTPGLTEIQSLVAAGEFMSTLAGIAKGAGLPLINMSFGQGWTADNSWHGNYDKVGDLSPWCDFGNAHTYPGANPPRSQIEAMNFNAEIAASDRPVAITEFGYDTGTVTQDVQAKYLLTGLADALDLGAALWGWYALCDDMAGPWGLFNADWTPRPAATALHNVLVLLADTGAAAATFAPGALFYTLSGARSLLFQRADGVWLIVAWGETAGGLGQLVIDTAHRIDVLDPMAGTTPSRTLAATKAASLALQAWPVVLRLTP